MSETTIRTPLREFWRRFRRKRLALAAAGVLIAIALTAIFAPWVAPYDLATPDYDALLEGPSWAHLCGTDAYGRDIFSRIVWGGRISLSIGFLSVALGGVAGIVLGLISGFFGGWIDTALMRLM